MKAILTVLLSGAALLAQTPAPAKKAASPAKSATPAKAAAPAKSAAPAKAAAAPRAGALLNPAAFKARCPDLLKVKFVTTHGDVVVDIHRDWAPLGADRFYNLVRGGYFNDSAFYRYAPGFIVQFGAAANPAVNAAWEKAPIKDDPPKQSNKKGTLVFAHGGPNTRTTQMFFNLKDNGASLDSQGFPAIGEVTEGMAIVEGLYSGYGEMAEMGGRGPSQELLSKQGKAYIDKSFPKLDSIKSIVVLSPEPTAAPAPAKSATPAKSAAPAKKATPAAPPAKK